MELRIFVEPQLGATYDDQLAMARATEQARLGGFFRSDHFLAPGVGADGDPAAGAPGPTDTFLTLAALARETSTVRLGVLVTSATFRLPGLLAVQAAQVDAMSGGRLELGVGAGWMREEHEALGIPFPPPAERFERLEETLQVLAAHWSTPAGGRFDHRGRHFTLAGDPALPRPVQRPGPPVIVGGSGLRRTPDLAARFAAELNVPFLSVRETAARFAAAREACERVGRDPATLALSATVRVFCGSNQRAADERVAATGRDVDLARERGESGTPAFWVAQLARFGDLGASRVYAQLLDMHDTEHVALLGAEVAPRLAGLTTT